MQSFLTCLAIGTRYSLSPRTDITSWGQSRNKPFILYDSLGVPSFKRPNPRRAHDIPRNIRREVRRTGLRLDNRLGQASRHRKRLLLRAPKRHGGHFPLLSGGDSILAGDVRKRPTCTGLSLRRDELMRLTQNASPDGEVKLRPI